MQEELTFFTLDLLIPSFLKGKQQPKAHSSILQSLSFLVSCDLENSILMP